MLSDQQKATNYETLKHIELVMQFLATMQHELAKRMFSHDRSKLRTPEMEMFAEFTDKLARLTYGSEDYLNCLDQMKRSALGHHYEHNRHHPEFFVDYAKDTVAINYCKDLIESLRCIKPQQAKDTEALDGAITLLEQHQCTLESNVNAMNLIDILEMVCDWQAACKRHSDGDIYKSVEINTKRFGLSYQLVAILLNTLPLLQSIYATDTQKHL